MINIIPIILDAIGTTTTTDINIWTIVLPIIVSALTGGLIAIITKLLDRPKTLAEEDKIKVDAKKARAETDAIQNEETWKLYEEVKTQYSNLKKESDDQIEKLKKESGEQMDFLRKQISIHSETLKLQDANFQTQEETIEQLKQELTTERMARQKIELALKKFQQWAIRNKAELEANHIEPVPVEVYL